MKLAAIDIGSNAVRLLISQVHETPDGPVFRKASLYRAPVRLGQDAFMLGEIAEPRVDDLAKAMSAFRNLMEIHRVNVYRACATSALRDAHNCDCVIERVLDLTGIQIEVIDGSLEAQYISHNFNVRDYAEGSYLYIDVGGGSTELTLLENGQRIKSRSFDIGTIRLLNDLVDSSSWNDMQCWCDEHVRPRNATAIGSGGNINKIHKLYKRKDGTMTQECLRRIHREVQAMSFQERMIRLGLREDRADVIVPAARIFVNVMKWSAMDAILVPKVGLSDGIVRALYREQLNGQSNA